MEGLTETRGFEYYCLQCGCDSTRLDIIAAETVVLAGFHDAAGLFHPQQYMTLEHWGYFSCGRCGGLILQREIDDLPFETADENGQTGDIHSYCEVSEVSWASEFSDESDVVRFRAQHDGGDEVDEYDNYGEDDDDVSPVIGATRAIAYGAPDSSGSS